MSRYLGDLFSRCGKTNLSGWSSSGIAFCSKERDTDCIFATLPILPKGIRERRQASAIELSRRCLALPTGSIGIEGPAVVAGPDQELQIHCCSLLAGAGGV